MIISLLLLIRAYFFRKYKYRIIKSLVKYNIILQWIISIEIPYLTYFITTVPLIDICNVFYILFLSFTLNKLLCHNVYHVKVIEKIKARRLIHFPRISKTSLIIANWCLIGSSHSIRLPNIVNIIILSSWKRASYHLYFVYLL